MQLLTEDEARALLAECCRNAGNPSRFADEAGISPAYVSDVLAKRRGFGPKILKVLGLERVLMFRERAK